jgi:membrane protein YqaA with SNARE-associated domain
MNHFIQDYGAVGLTLVSFIASTIVPLSSEAALIGAMKLGMPASQALLFASIGNCLGVLFNYGLGWWGSQTRVAEKFRSRSGKRALAWGQRYGKWSLLLSWLPFVGDPLTIVAGFLRMELPVFFLIAGGVRVLRYVVLIYAFGPVV